MKHKNFFMVANKIFDFGLKPKELSVFCCLLRHCDDKMQCFPSRRMIAKECSIAMTTVDSAMNTLTALGLVHKINRKRKDGSKSSNRYQVSNLIELDSS